jgi:hypothetical protein
METQIRKKTLDYVKKNIETISDDGITKLYNKIISIKNDNNDSNNDNNSDDNSNDDNDGCNNKQTNRLSQMVFIENNLRYMNRDNLEYVKTIVTESITYIENKEEKMKRVMLEILNKILIAMEKEEIPNICDFKNIYRDELIKDKYKKIIDDNLTYIINNEFSKNTCMVYHQKKIKNYHLSIIKGMLKSINFKLSSKKIIRYINKEKHTYIVYYVDQNTEENLQ